MPGSDDNKREHTLDEMYNWNLDRSVDYPVMLIGLMGKTSGGYWVPLYVSANGGIV